MECFFTQEIDLAPWIWDALERTNIREAYQRRLNRLQEARGEDGNNVYPIDSPEEKDYEDDLEKKIATEYDTVPLRQTRETEKGDEPSNGNKDETKTGETGSTQMEGSTESGTNNGPPYSEEGSGKKEKFKPRVNFTLSSQISSFLFTSHFSSSFLSVIYSSLPCNNSYSDSHLFLNPYHLVSTFTIFSSSFVHFLSPFLQPPFDLMTTIAIPVLNRRNSTVSLNGLYSNRINNNSSNKPNLKTNDKI